MLFTSIVLHAFTHVMVVRQLDNLSLWSDRFLLASYGVAVGLQLLSVIYSPGEPVRGGAAGLEGMDSHDPGCGCLIVDRGVHDALDPEAYPNVGMTGMGETQAPQTVRRYKTRYVRGMLSRCAKPAFCARSAICVGFRRCARGGPNSPSR